MSVFAQLSVYIKQHLVAPLKGSYVTLVDKDWWSRWPKLDQSRGISALGVQLLSSAHYLSLLQCHTSVVLAILCPVLELVCAGQLAGLCMTLLWLCRHRASWSL